MILDIHSHREAPYPDGIISLRKFDGDLLEEQLYSAGIHPWDTTLTDIGQAMNMLSSLLTLPNVVAVGECGVDPGKGAPMFRQLQILRKQIELSEKIRKPLVLHSVKSSDIILGLKRDLNPAQPWIIHGFRGKPAQARQLTDKGIYLSFGEKYNPDTVIAMPGEMMLAETDESALSIQEIIESLSRTIGEDITPRLEDNVRRVFKF